MHVDFGQSTYYYIWLYGPRRFRTKVLMTREYSILVLYYIEENSILLYYLCVVMSFGGVACEVKCVQVVCVNGYG